VQSALLIGDPGHEVDYFQCATEGGTCTTTAAKYVAFGANGNFLFKTVGFDPDREVSAFSCSRAFFGGDPAPNVAKACYLSNYTNVGGEGASLTTGSSPRNIAFGANGKFNFATITGAYTCNSATFGDPIFNVVKACYAAVVDYQFSTNENGNMFGLNNTPVAFGANGRFAFIVASGTLPCTTTAFGSDPAQNVFKACYRLPKPFVTDEGGSFTVNNGTFRYGSALNGNFLPRNITGTFSCSNTTFMGDPDFGHTKHCYGP